jgi:cytochrome P450
MAGTLFYISRHPMAYEKVTKEIRECFASIDEIQLEAKLNSCTYLRACIDETLRMSPAAGSSLWREVQKGGITLNGAYIPEGCDVGVGVYSIQHNPKYWPEPSRFNPDRWLKTKSGAIKATDGKGAYMPFSIGSRSCIGKGLAIAEAMLALATFIWKFDFKDAEFEGGHTLDQNPGEFELHDHVTGAKNGPILRLRLRE